MDTVICNSYFFYPKPVRPGTSRTWGVGWYKNVPTTESAHSQAGLWFYAMIQLIGLPQDKYAIPNAILTGHSTYNLLDFNFQF